MVKDINVYFIKKKDIYSGLAKYSDLGKKQYNSNKEKNQAYLDLTSKFYLCSYSNLVSKTNYHPRQCGSDGYINIAAITDCDNLYWEYYNEIDNKYLFDRWINTIIFSCFIIACDIGLAIFGFLLFKSDGSGI